MKRGLSILIVLLTISGCESEDKIKEMSTNLQLISKNIKEINKKTKELELKKDLNNSKFINQYQQTICFSQKKYGEFNLASLGDTATLNSGECKGRTLIEMNKDGWRLIQVVTGVNDAFGMVLEKK